MLLEITKPKVIALNEKLESYKNFTEIVTEYNKNKNELKKDLNNRKDFDTNTKDRDEYFLGLIKKQANLKDIPKNAGVSTFGLLYKRVIKLCAIISTYVTGKKHEDFKEKWGGDKIDRETKKDLEKSYKYWIEYLDKLIEFLENEENESKVEELFIKKIKSKNDINGDTKSEDDTKNEGYIAGELKKILGAELSSTETMGKFIENIATDVSLMNDVEYNVQYRLFKNFLTRVRKNYDYKKTLDNIEPYDIEMIFSSLIKENVLYFIDIDNQKEIIKAIKNNKKAKESNKETTEKMKQVYETVKKEKGEQELEQQKQKEELEKLKQQEKQELEKLKQQEKQELEKQKQAKQKELDELKQQKELEKQQEKDELEQQKQKEELEQQKEELEQQKQAKQKELDELEKQKQATQKELDELKQQIELEKQAKQKELDELEQQKQKQKEELDKLKQQIEQQKQAKQKEQEEIEKLKQAKSKPGKRERIGNWMRKHSLKSK